MACRPTLVAVLIAYKPYFRGLGGWGAEGGFAAIKRDTSMAGMEHGVGTLGWEEGQPQGCRANRQDRYPLHYLALGPDRCRDEENPGAKPTKVAPTG